MTCWKEVNYLPQQTDFKSMASQRYQQPQLSLLFSKIPAKTFNLKEVTRKFQNSRKHRNDSWFLIWKLWNPHIFWQANSPDVFHRRAGWVIGWFWRDSFSWLGKESSNEVCDYVDGFWRIALRGTPCVIKELD